MANYRMEAEKIQDEPVAFGSAKNKKVFKIQKDGTCQRH